MNRSLGLLARITLLTLAWLATRALLAHAVPGPADTAEPLTREASNALVQVAFLTATAISAVTMRSHWCGLRLLASLVVLQVGLGTLVPLLELLAFPAYGKILPAGQVLHTTVLGVTTSVVVSVVAVMVFARFRSSPIPRTGPLSARHAAARLAGAAVVFVAVTITAAYLATCRQPVFAFLHGLAGTTSFGEWLRLALSRHPWLPGVQALRALVALGALLLLVAGDRGPRHLAAGLAGAVTSVLVGAPLLVPVPWLSETIRLTHLPEVIWTMLPLGIFLAELLLLGQGAPPAPEEDLMEGKPLLDLDSE